MTMRRIVAGGLALAAAVVLVGWTAFHLELNASYPEADADLGEAPTEIWLRFSVEPDMERSSFSVRGPEGRVALGDISVGEEPEVIRALTTLPERLNEITYVAQTRSILERRQRRVARLRSDTRRELLGVLHDIQGDAKHQLEKVQSDLRSRAESVWARCAKTKLGHEVEQVPERVTELADQWLDKVGLVRKARLAS